MTTLEAGSATSLLISNNGFLEVATGGGFGSVTITPTGGVAVSEAWGPAPFRKRWTGYPDGAAVSLTNTTSASFDYETDTTNLPLAVQALVQGGGMRSLVQYLPSATDITVDAAAATVTPGPVTAANVATEAATLRAALTRSYNFRTSNAETAKWLNVPGGIIDTQWYGTAAQSEAYTSGGTDRLFENGVFELVTDATDIAIMFYGQSATVAQFLIDGVTAQSSDYTTTAPLAGDNREMWFRFVFSGRKPRVIEFQQPAGVRLWEVRCGPTATIWKPGRRPRIKIVADSFGVRRAAVGETEPTSSDAIARVGAVISRVLGFAVPVQSCAGGTGFAKTFTNTGNYAWRMTREAADPTIDVVWLWGSGNDLDQTEAAVRQGVTDAIGLAKSKHPTTRIIVTGILGGMWTEDATHQAVTSWVRTQALSLGATYIPVASYETGDQGVIFGTGRVGATTGDGNADVYLGGGGTDRHWNVAGIKYYARRMAQTVAAAIAA